MWKVYQGDVLEVLRQLPDEFVQCVVTSPPYYGLRDYGVNGQIGLEKIPEEYVDKLIEVFREIRRVLRKDGTVWLNLGDSYNGSRGAGGDYNKGGLKEGQPKYPGRSIPNLKPKDLIGIPWRVAFALQADGWYLRSDIIWHKSNCMPESVKDRPTRAHEYIFLLTKSPRYFYDAEAIKEPLAKNSGVAYRNQLRKGKKYNAKDPYQQNFPANFDITGKNRRSVWTINTRPYKGTHFALFPPGLPKLCILAGTSPKACPKCGAPWERVVERDAEEYNPKEAEKRIKATGGVITGGTQKSTLGVTDKVKMTTVAWQPTCSCSDNDGSGKCIVLDPFAGSGTTLQVAEEHGRDSLGIELNPDYCKLIEERMANLSKTRQVSLF